MVEVNGSEIANLSSLAQLQFVSTTVLQQALDLVENILTSDEQLTIQSKFLPGSTIGTLVNIMILMWSY